MNDILDGGQIVVGAANLLESVLEGDGRENKARAGLQLAEFPQIRGYDGRRTDKPAEIGAVRGEDAWRVPSPIHASWRRVPVAMLG